MDFKQGYTAHRWIMKDGKNDLVPIKLSGGSKLIGIDDEIKLVYKNITYFTQGNPALNILLWGEKGSGKSTLVRSIANNFYDKGLIIIEFSSTDYYSIYDLYELAQSLPDKYFAIYFDDISFDDNDAKYRNFKSIVEGGLEEKPSNLIYIVTSNRRHIITSAAKDTQDIYSRDENNETSSLHARFGLTVGFYPISQALYLEIVASYLKSYGIALYSGWEQEAAAFAIERGGVNGRTAKQFAIYRKIVVTDI